MGWLHDQEVLKQAWMYESEGYNVEADHIAKGKGRWSKPNLINGRLPDVIAWRGELWSERLAERIIVEVETPASIGCDHTRNQIEAFKKAARECRVTTFKLVSIYRGGSLTATIC